MVKLLGAIAGAGPAGAGDDCLTLNVWTPGLDDGKRPILFWIHGGAFMMGSGGAQVYDGAELARRGDLVVVTINYRLGAHGFLQLADVVPDGPFVSNPGLRDQVAALEWVHEHADRFGGDPERVTIFGESAGGMSVGALLAAPAAQGLFRGAIAQSGAAHNVSSREAAARVGETFLTELGLSAANATDLLALPDADLLKAQRKAAVRLIFDHRGLPFQPAEDGDWYPEQPLDAIAGGRGAKVPLLVGTNRDEWDLFQAGDRKANTLDDEGLKRRFERAVGADDVDATFLLYREVHDGRTPKKVWGAFQTDRVFRAPAERLAEAHSEHAPVHAYCFTWSPPHLRRFMGAGHAMEVPLLFGTWRHPVLRGIMLGARTHSRKIQDHWIAFAHGGDPGSTDWAPYTPEKRDVRILGPVDRHALRGFEPVRDYWTARDHGTRG
jgi:para-nitrobenzyl esterase